MTDQTQKNFLEIIKTEKFDSSILEISSDLIFEDVLDDCVDLCYGEGLKKENIEYLEPFELWKLKIKNENTNHRVFFRLEEKGERCVLLWVEPRTDETYPIEETQVKRARKNTNEEDIKDLG